MSADLKPQPHELWKQAGGGTDAYSSEQYRALLVEHGHLIKRESEDGLRLPRPFELWKQCKGDPETYLQLVNSNGPRLRLKRGVKMSGEVARELYLHAELSYLETVETYGNWHIAIDHKRGALTHGAICDRTTRHIYPTCAFCHRQETGERMCDWPTGNPCKKCAGKSVQEDVWHFMPSLVQIFPCYDCNATGIQTCSKPACLECVSAKDGRDYCPNHSEKAGAGAPRSRVVQFKRPTAVSTGAKLKREPCEWKVAPMIVNRKCRRESCSRMISADDRVLYFPQRGRAMCAPCGELYLEIAK